MFYQGGSAQGSSLAAGTILVALIETLKDKGALSHSDVSAILQRSDDVLKPQGTIASNADARDVIAALVKHFGV